MGVNFLKGFNEHFKTDKNAKDFSDSKEDPPVKNFSEQMKDLRVYSFIRGIDGFSKTVEEDDSSADNQAHATKVLGENSANWRDPPPHGERQVDYIRRIADKIQREQKGEEPIRAVGILGTDIYDKLLLMRALKPVLGKTVFFTTDLDAHLWHSSEIEFTRNILVGTSYPLSLHPNIQKGVAPFRDSYQVSIFSSVLAALEVFRKPYEIDRYSPHVFEIGTRGPVQVGGGKYVGKKIENDNREALFARTPSGHYEQSFWILLIVSVVAMAIILVVAWAYCRPFEGERVSPWVVLMVLFIVVIAVASWSMGPSGNLSFEPIGWPDGTSAWFTFFLNWCNTILAASFCAYIIFSRTQKLRVALRNSSIAERFERTTTSLFSKDKWWPGSFLVGFGVTLAGTFLYGISTQSVKDDVYLLGVVPVILLVLQVVTHVWLIIKLNEHGEGKLDPWVGCCLGLSRFVLFPLLCSVLITWLWAVVDDGYNFLPMRGGEFQWLFGLSQLFQFVSMITLLSFVLHESLLVMAIVLGLSRRNPKTYEVEFFQVKPSPHKGPWVSDPTVGLQCVEFAAKLSRVPNRYLFFPFLVLFVWYVSYHEFFEGWPWTDFRLVVFLILFSLCMLPSILIRTAALRLKRRVIRAANEQRMVKLTTAKNSAPEDLVSVVESIREGAYAPFLNQPFLLAILSPLGGIGSIALVQMLLSH